MHQETTRWQHGNKCSGQVKLTIDFRFIVNQVFFGGYPHISIYGKQRKI